MVRAAPTSACRIARLAMRGLVAARAAVLTAVVAIDGDNVVPRIKVSPG